MKLFSFMWRRKWVILSCGMLFSLAFFAYSCFNTYYTESMIISFIYPNSEKGYYPDGSRFNIYGLVSNEVLQDAVDKYNKESGKSPISVDDVKDNIKLNDYLAGAVSDRIKSARSLGQDYTYFTNEYTVSLKPTRVFDINNKEKLFGLIPNINSKLFSQKLYESYTAYFMNEHTEMNIIPKITQNIMYDDYDYAEMADMFGNVTNMCINYLTSKSAENETFRSKSTNMSFNDLITGIQSLKDVSISNLQSFVSSSKLSKNPSDLIDKYKTQIERDTLDYNKAKAESDISTMAMRQYDHTFEENIVVTGINEEVGLYQARPKTAYDTITKRALSAGVKAADTMKDIENLNWQIEQYSKGPISEEEKVRLFKVADGMVDEIQKESKRLFDLANVTVDDYLSFKSNDYVRKTQIEKTYINRSIIIKSGFMFCVAAFGIFLFMFFLKRENWTLTKDIIIAVSKNGKKDKKEEPIDKEA